MSLRILVAGADSDYAIERPYRKYLAQSDDVSSLEFFAAQNIFLDYYRGSLCHKLLYRAGLSRILHTINADLLETARQFRPDILLVFKGMEIFPSTLRKIREQGALLVNYNPDNPFVFSGRGSGNRNVTDSIGLFDLYLSYDSAVCSRLEQERKLRSGLLPFGFEIDENLFRKCSEQEEVLKVCFIGNPDRDRVEFVNKLASSGLVCDVYGTGWEKWRLHANISAKGYLSGDAYWMALRRYRVQLNLMRPHNPDSHNMRSFEIPGIGGIQLAPATEDHSRYFMPGSEIFLFKNEEDCALVCKKLLSLDRDAAMRIRISARDRGIRAGYSYEDRSRELLSWMRKLKERGAA